MSAKALCLASPVFTGMFDQTGPWASANPSANKDYHLHDDDPDALLLLLHVAHLQFQKLPVRTLWFEEVYNITSLSSVIYTMWSSLVYV